MKIRKVSTISILFGWSEMRWIFDNINNHTRKILCSFIKNNYVDYYFNALAVSLHLVITHRETLCTSMSYWPESKQKVWNTKNILIYLHIFFPFNETLLVKIELFHSLDKFYTSNILLWNDNRLCNFVNFRIFLFITRNGNKYFGTCILHRTRMALMYSFLFIPKYVRKMIIERSKINGLMFDMRVIPLFTKLFIYSYTCIGAKTYRSGLCIILYSINNIE